MTARLLLLPFLLLVGCSDAGDGHDRKGEHADEHGSHGPDEPGAEKHNEAAEEGHDEHDEGAVRLDPEAAAAAGIRTDAVGLRALLPQMQTTGQVDFNQNRLAHVGPRTEGRVAEVRADLGAKLSAGEIVAVIDSVELGRARAEFLGARANREVTEAALAREEALVAEKISSQAEVLRARAAFQQSRAQESAAAETLRVLGLSSQEVSSLQFGAATPGQLPLRSPFQGTLVERHLQLGEFVTQADTLFTVADLSSLWIWIDVYERDLARVHLGDLAAVEAAGYPGRSWTGEVTYLRDTVDPDTRTVRARIEVANADGALRPQMFVTVGLSDPHHDDAVGGADVLAVPSSAVQRRGGRTVVYVEEEPGHFEERAVELGHQSAGFSEVLSGLTSGERVVTAGAFVLKTEASRESLGGGHSH